MNTVLLEADVAVSYLPKMKPTASCRPRTPRGAHLVLQALELRRSLLHERPRAFHVVVALLRRL
jgi:hypothetical protein